MTRTRISLSVHLHEPEAITSSQYPTRGADDIGSFVSLDVGGGANLFIQDAVTIDRLIDELRANKRWLIEETLKARVAAADGAVA